MIICIATESYVYLTFCHLIFKWFLRRVGENILIPRLFLVRSKESKIILIASIASQASDLALLVGCVA